MLGVSPQEGFYKYLSNKDFTKKYQDLANDMKSDDLLKKGYHSDAPLEKGVTDITEIKEYEGKLYVSAIFACFDLGALELTMTTNMKAELCVHTLGDALTSYPSLEGAIIHSDRVTQYTSEAYRKVIREKHILQSMNNAGGHCNDNACCESMWARRKTELLYDRYDTEQKPVEELKELIWSYLVISLRKMCQLILTISFDLNIV